MKVLVLNRMGSEGRLPNGYGDLPTDILISIRDPNSKYPTRIPEGYLDVLKVRFHDIDSPLPGYLPMPIYEAERILTFVGTWLDKAELLVVHCDAGISRSPAVAIALADLFREKIHPCAEALIERYPCFNRHVYRTIFNFAHGEYKEYGHAEMGSDD